MNEDDFIVWVMGCRCGLEDLAKMKFKFSNHVQSLRTAGPAATAFDIKKSLIDVSVNKQADSSLEHFVKVIVGIGKEESNKRRQELQEGMGNFNF